MKLNYNSPNYNDRPPNAVIDTIIIHYTEFDNVNEALEILCNEECKVSSHYVIEKNGTIYQLVDEEKRAWHAGISYWNGRDNINNYSIGIELDNNGKEPYPIIQMKFLIELCKEIICRHKIKYILGHSDIAPIRKIDPGIFFDWKLLEDALDIVRLKEKCLLIQKKN